MRYPEAKTIVKHLISFFTHFGMPKELQSARGVDFISNLFKQMLTEWGINCLAHTILSHKVHWRGTAKPLRLCCALFVMTVVRTGI